MLNSAHRIDQHPWDRQGEILGSHKGHTTDLADGGSLRWHPRSQM